MLSHYSLQFLVHGGERIIASNSHAVPSFCEIFHGYSQLGIKRTGNLNEMAPPSIHSFAILSIQVSTLSVLGKDADSTPPGHVIAHILLLIKAVSSRFIVQLGNISDRHSGDFALGGNCDP